VTENILTLAQIHAAQTNDLDAIRAVLAEMDSRITRLANKAAGGLATNPARYSDYAEEFRQDALVALFEYLPRWEGDSVDAFREYLYGAIAGELKAKTNAERNAGVDRDAFSTFKAMMEITSDVFEAEKLAQTVPAKGKRLSADRAFAARLAWQGPVSIDKTSDDDDETSILHTLAVTDESNDEIRPKVGRGAALEALAVLQTYSTAREVLSALPVSVSDVDTIEDTLTVPRDEMTRRYVLDAVAILRSYVSTTTDSDLATDLRDVSDDRREERAAKHEDVNTALDKLSPGQRGSLVHSFGIGGVECYGWGDGCDLEGLAEALNTTTGSAKKTRSVAKVSFTKHYVARVAERNPAEAAALTAEAAAGRKHAGRK
jgi:DNA-directed RNA polymerase specialized sigma24 family protein